MVLPIRANINYIASSNPIEVKSTSAQEDIDNLLRDTILQICTRDRVVDPQRFNNSQFINKTKKYLNLAKNKEDVEFIVGLLIQNAEPLLQQVNSRYNSNLNFGQLLSLRRQYPGQPLAKLLVFLVAEQDPQLAPFANRFLPAGHSSIVQDPHIQYVQALQSQIKLTSLEPGEIYQRTNEADREYLSTVERNNNITQEDKRTRNYRRLALLDLEKNDSPEERLEYIRARIRDATGAAV